MTGGKHLQQRMLKSRRTRARVQKVPPQAPFHYPTPQLPSSSQAGSTWVSSAPHPQPLPHTPHAGSHHISYIATALELPNLLEASLLEQQIDSQPPSSKTTSTSKPSAINSNSASSHSLQRVTGSPSTGSTSFTEIARSSDSLSGVSFTGTTAGSTGSAGTSSSAASRQGPLSGSLDEDDLLSIAFDRPFPSHGAPTTSLPGTTESGIGSLQRPARVAAILATMDSDLDDLLFVGKPKTAPIPAHVSSRNTHSGRRMSPPSPEHIATLARVFRLTEEKAQALAVSRPTLLLYSEEQVAQRTTELAELLQMRETQALLAIRKQPFLLEVDMPTLQGRLSELQAQLGLDLQVTCRLVSNAPSVLKRPADKLGERFERLAQSLAMTKAQVVDMSGRCSHTQFLTERSRKLQARFEALAETLHLDADQTAKVVRRQPDILFMSSRILANKVKVLQAVFSTKHRKVTPLVAKCPEVLRRDMNSIRRIVCMLQVMLNLAPEYVYKMMAHNARLLSMNFQSTQWKAAQLRQAASSCPCWSSQWQSMLPRHMEHCLAATQTTYHRLDYIMQTGQQEKMKLLDALRVPLFKFEEAFPGYNPWLQQQQMRQQQAAAH